MGKRAVHSQMPDFMCSNDDTAEATSVLDDGHAVDLLQAFVDHARASDIGEAWWRSSGGGQRTTRYVEVTRDSVSNLHLPGYRCGMAVREGAECVALCISWVGGFVGACVSVVYRGLVSHLCVG